MRIFVDMPGGVDFDHCQEFHMRIRDLFDDIDYDYLEVSSPGDRPLKRDADFVRMAGSPVQVLSLIHIFGDTLRVSLTGDVVREVETGIEILRSLGLRRQGMEIVSCPTCGRCNICLLYTSRCV